VFCVFKQQDLFLSFISGLPPKIKFIMEIGDNSQLNVLDHQKRRKPQFQDLQETYSHGYRHVAVQTHTVPASLNAGQIGPWTEKVQNILPSTLSSLTA